MFTKTFLLLGFICLILPWVTYAQMTGVSGSGLAPDLVSELIVNMTPAHPAPGEKVSVRLEMYTENLDTAEISWILGGSVMQKGKGFRDFSFTAPLSGKSTTLNLNVRLQNGTTFQKSVSLAPIDLSILWEANSYTPPFYRGKALFPPQGQVKLFALSDRQNLIYKWTINGEVRPELGGFNRNSAVVAGPILGAGMEVEVLATNSSSDIVVEKSIFINPQNPSILFYENSPLYGVIFEKSITSIPLSGEEISVLAVPYNASRENINNVNYVWKINGVQVSGINGLSATFRKPSGATGRSLIFLDMENAAKPLQSIESSFSINFE